MKKREFIIQDILCKIYQDQFSDGKLPNQRTLAEKYGVSRFTVQQSIKSMEEMGILNAVQGSGIYINKKWNKNPLLFNSVIRTPYDRIESKVISLFKRKVTPEERQIFQLNENDDIWEFKRVRIVNFKMEQVEQSKMPVALFPDLTEEIVEGSIQDYVVSKGLQISHYLTSYNPIKINKEESELLLCKKGMPAMKIQNRCLLEDGRIFEYSDIIAIDYGVTYIRPFDKQTHNYRRE